MEDSTIHQVADGAESLQTASPDQVSKPFSFRPESTQSPSAVELPVYKEPPALNMEHDRGQVSKQFFSPDLTQSQDGLSACEEPPALTIKHNRGFKPRGGFPDAILRILERWHEKYPYSNVGHPAKINLNPHRVRNFKIFDEDANEFEKSIWDVSKARRSAKPLVYHVMVIHSEHGPDQLCADAIARGSLHDISPKVQGQFIFAWNEAEAKFDNRFFALRVWQESGKDVDFSPRFFECDALPRHPPAICQLGWVPGSPKSPKHVGSNWKGEYGNNPSTEKAPGALGSTTRSVKAPKRVKTEYDSDPDYVDEPRPRAVPRPRVVMKLNIKEPNQAESALSSPTSTLSPALSIPSPVDSTLGPCFSPVGAGSPITGSPMVGSPVAESSVAESSMAGSSMTGSPKAESPVAESSMAGFSVAGFSVAGSPMAASPMAGYPMAGSSVAGYPMAGSPMAGSPVARFPMAGNPMAGSSVAGSPRAASLMAGYPMAGSPMAGSPVAASPMAAPSVAGSPMLGSLMEGVTLSGGRSVSAAPTSPETETPQPTANASSPQDELNIRVNVMVPPVEWVTSPYGRSYLAMVAGRGALRADSEITPLSLVQTWDITISARLIRSFETSEAREFFGNVRECLRPAPYGYACLHLGRGVRWIGENCVAEFGRILAQVRARQLDNLLVVFAAPGDFIVW